MLNLKELKVMRLRKALRQIALDERDERYLTHYSKIWDEDTVEVICGWLEKARNQNA